MTVPKLRRAFARVLALAAVAIVMSSAVTACSEMITIGRCIALDNTRHKCN